MNRTEIINDVRDFTEHKADERIDYNRAFVRRLQKFCQSKTFWWRKKVYSYTANMGDTTTDLSSQIRDFEAFISVTLWLNGQKVASLDPCFDPEAVSDMQEATAIAGTPGRYTLEPGETLKIRFDCPMDAGYKVKIAYWAIPNPATDDSDDTVPLVPAIYHHALVSGLKMDIAAYLYGVDSKSYVVSMAEYAESVEKAEARPDFSTKKATQFINHSENAISSVPGDVSARYY